jgi:hypothetical protein
MHDLAPAGDHDLPARQQPVIDVARKVGVDAGESFRVEAGLAGVDGALEDHVGFLPFNPFNAESAAPR